MSLLGLFFISFFGMSVGFHTHDERVLAMDIHGSPRKDLESPSKLAKSEGATHPAPLSIPKQVATDYNSSPMLRKNEGQNFDVKRLHSEAPLAQVEEEIRTPRDLMICNAFAWSTPLNVYHRHTKLKLTENPIEYKDCSMLKKTMIKDGDKLKFTSNGLSVGTFHITELPVGSPLLLVAHRKDENTSSLDFASSMFTDMEEAQIAVVDTYRGASEGQLRLTESHFSDVRPEHAEVIEPNSVISVGAGKYQVSRKNNNEDVVSPAALQFSVNDGDKVVIMRTGNDNRGTASLRIFPEELVMFPRESDKSGAVPAGHLHLFTVVVVLACSALLF